MKHFWMSGEQMLVIIAAVAMLHCCDSGKVKAQGIGPAQQPMFTMLSASTSGSVTNSFGLAYYWNYQDLPIGAVSGGWTDRLQGVVSKPVGTAPNNTTNGIDIPYSAAAFNYLTNDPIPYVTNSVYGVILKGYPQVATYGAVMGGSVGTYPFWIYKDDIGNPSRSNHLDWGAPTAFNMAPMFCTTNLHTITCAWSNGTINVWRDDLPTHTGSQGIYTTFNMVSIGGAGGSTAANQWEGLMREVLIWTNVLDATEIATNLFRYATNTYGYP